MSTRKHKYLLKECSRQQTTDNRQQQDIFNTTNTDASEFTPTVPVLTTAPQHQANDCASMSTRKCKYFLKECSRQQTTDNSKIHLTQLV
jgi:hypothetical protein